MDYHKTGTRIIGRPGRTGSVTDMGRRLTAPGIDLAGRDFSGQNVPWSVEELEQNYSHHLNFTGANLTGCDFTGLRHYASKNFTGANLTGTRFLGVQLMGSVMTGAIMSHNYDAAKWQSEGLMPVLDDGSVLVWKHVTKQLTGNLGYPYELGVTCECASMTTAGPMGAIREWHGGDIDPHVIAVAAHALYDYCPEKGIYYAFRGTPIALYRAENRNASGCDFVRVAGTPGQGNDPLGLL